MNTKITLDDIKNYGVDKDKLSSLTLTDRYFYRPIANNIAYFLYNFFSFSPNMISILSGVFALIGFLIMFIFGMSYIYLGILFLIAWAILDCADGSLARTLFYKYNIRNPLGEFYDAFVGYIMVAFLWFSIGWLVYKSNNNDLFIFLGALSSIVGLYSRLVYAKLSLVKRQNSTDNEIIDARKSFIYLLYENIEFGSALLPMLLIAAYFGFIPLFIILYLIINFAMLLWLINHIISETKSIS